MTKPQTRGSSNWRNYKNTSVVRFSRRVVDTLHLSIFVKGNCKNPKALTNQRQVGHKSKALTALLWAVFKPQQNIPEGFANCDRPKRIAITLQALSRQLVDKENLCSAVAANDSNDMRGEELIFRLNEERTHTSELHLSSCSDSATKSNWRCKIKHYVENHSP